MTGLTPDITEAAVVSYGALRLTFADGLTGEVDVLDADGRPIARALTTYLLTTSSFDYLPGEGR